MDAAERSEEFGEEILRLTSGLRTHCTRLRAGSNDLERDELTQEARALTASLAASPFALLQRCVSVLERVDHAPTQLRGRAEETAEGVLDALRLACGLVEQLLDQVLAEEHADAARTAALYERLDSTIPLSWIPPPVVEEPVIVVEPEPELAEVEIQAEEVEVEAEIVIAPAPEPPAERLPVEEALAPVEPTITEGPAEAEPAIEATPVIEEAPAPTRDVVAEEIAAAPIEAVDVVVTPADFRTNESFEALAPETDQQSESLEAFVDAQEPTVEPAREAEPSLPEATPPAVDPAEEFRRLLAEAFAEESEEVFASCVDSLKRIESDAHAPEPLYDLFRAFHTLKGAAAAVELEALSEEFRKGEHLLEKLWEEAQAKALQIPRANLSGFLHALVTSYRGHTDRARGVFDSPHELLTDFDFTVDALRQSSASPAQKYEGQE